MGVQLLRTKKIDGAKETAPCLYIRSDGKVSIIDVVKSGPSILDHENRRGWAISNSRKKLFKNTNTVMQVISENSCAPQCIKGDENAYKSPNHYRLMLEELYNAYHQVEEENRQDITRLALMVGISMIGVCIMAVVVYALYAMGDTATPVVV